MGNIISSKTRRIRSPTDNDIPNSPKEEQEVEPQEEQEVEPKEEQEVEPQEEQEVEPQEEQEVEPQEVQDTVGNCIFYEEPKEGEEEVQWNPTTYPRSPPPLWPPQPTPFDDEGIPSE